jgi:hypothetical protein
VCASVSLWVLSLGAFGEVVLSIEAMSIWVNKEIISVDNPLLFPHPWVLSDGTNNRLYYFLVFSFLFSTSTSFLRALQFIRNMIPFIVFVIIPYHCLYGNGL